MKKNYYEILNVNPSAQSEEIKKAAYRQLNEITQAFKILSDVDKRQAYDLTWQTTPSSTTNYYNLLGVDPTTSPAIIEQAALAQLDEIKVALAVLSNTKKRQAYDLTIQPSLPFEAISPYQPLTPVINNTNNKKDDKDDLEKHNLEFKFASRTRRLSAVIIDAIIMYLPLFFISLTSFLVHGEEAAGIAMIFIFIGIYLWLPVFIIINLVLLYSYGQTIGKRLLSIKIVRSDGSHASLGRIILLRWLLGWLPVILPVILDISAIYQVRWTSIIVVISHMIAGIWLDSWILVISAINTPLEWFLVILNSNRPIIAGILAGINILISIDPLFIFRKDRRCLHDLIANTIVIAQSRVDHKQVSST